MNIVNEDILTKILTSNDQHSKITLLRWDVNNKIIKAGNNYMSEVSRLTIEYNKNGVPHKRHVFLKVPFNSPMYAMGMKFDIFRKELTMYTETLPQMYEIENEYFTARNYYVDEKQSLFLKDLSQTGYKVANRTEQLDFHHCCYALKCLAKYHALSVKVEKTRGLPDIIRNDPFYAKENQNDEMKNTFLAGLTKFYDSLPIDVQQKYASQIASFKTINWDNVIDDMNPDNGFAVLNHGDFWTNNIMFKYDKYGIIKKVKLIDFQICRWASPAIDLLYFTITSMRFDVFEQYFDLLLEIYIDTLNKVLKTLNCDTYAMNDLKNDIEKRYKYAIVVLTCMLPIIVSDPENPIDMTEVIKDKEFDMTTMHKTYQQKHYVQIATKWFIHYAHKIGNTIQNQENVDKSCNVETPAEITINGKLAEGS